MARPERVGIFGGTFDPVHIGHLVAANEARHQLALDRVLVVVAGDPWQKHGAVVAPASARYEMVAAAVAGVDGLEASRIEVDRSGATYTIDTVQQLSAPDRELWLVLGADVAAQLGTWHRADDLRAAVSLAVVDRRGRADPNPDPPGWRIAHVSMPEIEVSSTEIRRRIAGGEPVDFLVPGAAIRVLEERSLYTSA